MNKKTTARSLVVTSALFASAASLASAQEPVYYGDAPPPAATRVDPDWAVSLGLGVAKFTGNEADDATDMGLGWDVRVGYGLSYTVSLEGAFIATTQSINALGLDPDAKLKSYGLEALARVGLDQVYSPTVGPVVVAPFLFAGVAYQRYNLNDAGTNTSDVAEDDNVLAIPVGAGVGGIWGNILMDVRFTYRAAFDEDLFLAPTGENSDASLSNWQLGLRGGYAF
jgi:hypothetical protein